MFKSLVLSDRKPKSEEKLEKDVIFVTESLTLSYTDVTRVTTDKGNHFRSMCVFGDTVAFLSNSRVMLLDRLLTSFSLL